MLIDTPKIWYSPTRPFSYHYKILEHMDAITLDKKFKCLREAKTLAVAGFALFMKTGNPTFLNLCESDPPDGLLMRSSTDNFGTLEILKVEITHYFGRQNETLLEQLQRTKTPEKPIFGSDYLVLVELRTQNTIDYEEIRNYLNSINNPFPVWTLKPLQLTPDTIAEVIIINPDIHKIVVNAGEAAFKYKEQKVPHVLEIKRVAKPKDVRFEESETKIISKPLWETDAERTLDKLGIHLS